MTSDEVTEYLTENCRKNGYSAVNVSDGEVFMFSRGMIEMLLEQMNREERDTCIVFIQRPKDKKDQIIVQKN